jgi:predicted membrane channel-forming protein YqfA (hemolysin III family)
MSDAGTFGIRVLRVGTYFLAVITVSTGIVFAVLASYDPPAFRIATLLFAVAVGALAVLFVHQPFRRWSVLSLGFVVLSIVVPWWFVHDTPEPCSGRLPGICELRVNTHFGLRLDIFAVLLALAVTCSIVGFARARGRDGRVVNEAVSTRR